MGIALAFGMIYPGTGILVKGAFYRRDTVSQRTTKNVCFNQDNGCCVPM